MGLALTKKELAALAGYTYRRLHDIDMELPKEEKLFVRCEDNDKKYDAAIFVQRWVKYNTRVSEEESEELSTVKAKHEAVKMEKTKIEVARLKGEYVSITELAPIWSGIAAQVNERFNALPSKLAPSLVMIGDPEIIEEMIEREVRDAQRLMAGMPLPEAETETGSAEDAEDDA